MEKPHDLTDYALVLLLLTLAGIAAFWPAIFAWMHAVPTVGPQS